MFLPTGPPSDAVSDASDWATVIPERLSERERTIGRQVLKEIRARLGFLVDVGLDYLTLDRTSSTLSGGEAQRIRLATQIGSSLVGVLYILDEPSIGLHQRDNAKLIATLQRLRDLGNTLIVVEHDEETIRTADWVVDVGPAAGEHGGEIIASGSLEELLATPASITGAYLRGDRAVPIPAKRRPGNGKRIKVKGARAHNLKDVNVTFPLGTFTAVTGMFGWTAAWALTLGCALWLNEMVRGHARATRGEPRLVRVAGRMSNDEQAFVSWISVAWIALTLCQLAVTVAGNVAVIPLTGVTFPFVSFGMTSLVMNMAMLALAINVNIRNGSANG